MCGCLCAASRLSVAVVNVWLFVNPQLNQLMLMLQKQLEEKGREVNAYRAEHNIKIKGEGECGTGLSDSKPAGGGGVLVANTRS